MAVRWLIAGLATVGAFFLTWAAFAMSEVDPNVTFSLAGLLSSVVGGYLFWWAGREGLHRPGPVATAPEVARATEVASNDPGAPQRADAAARYALAALERDPELAILVTHAAVTELAPTPLAVHAQYLALALGIGAVRPRLAGHGVQALLAHSGPVVRLTWLADGQLVTGSSQIPHFRIWARSGALVATQRRDALREGKERLLHAGFAMDCTRAGDIATSTQDLVRLWSPTGAPVTSWHATARGRKAAGFTNLVLDLAWSPDGRWLAGGCADHTVRVWNPADKAVLYTLTGHQHPVRTVAWAPDGTALAGATREPTIRVWRVIDGRGHELVGHSGQVNAIAWAPDGRLASASNDGTVRLWDPTAARPER